jgi:putative FmdB family regulatory protein
MPTYQYLCEKCGTEFEVFQSMTDRPLTACPKEQCTQKKWGKGKVKRLIGAGAGIIFKGSGFYITDYRSKGYHDAAKKDSVAVSTTSSGTDSKPAKEAKPAKAENKPAAAKTAKAT